jgi:hypothetical protein
VLFLFFPAASNEYSHLTYDLLLFKMSLICGSLSISYSCFAGTPLFELIPKMKSFHSFCLEYNQMSTNGGFLATYQMVLNFHGNQNKSQPFILTGDVMDEEQHLAEQLACNNLGNVGWILSLKYIMGVYQNDIAGAKDAETLTKKLRPLMKGVGCISERHVVWCEGLICCVLALHTAKGRKRRKLKARVRGCLKKVQSFAQICPSNFRNKELLLEAEYASLEGKQARAMTLYDDSILCASKEGLLHEQALACEKAAYSVLRDEQNLPSALTYFEKSREVYERWGALMKVERLDMVLDEWSEIVKNVECKKTATTDQKKRSV